MVEHLPKGINNEIDQPAPSAFSSSADVDVLASYCVERATFVSTRITMEKTRQE